MIIRSFMTLCIFYVNKKLVLIQKEMNERNEKIARVWRIIIN